jgi:hypothetical protein
MQRTITKRGQLLVYIAGHIAYKYIAMALSEGEVENLGAFDINGSGGWIVRVRTLLTNKDYFISVSASDGAYRLLLTDVGPGWKYWEGDKCDNELYRGDHPDEYAYLKEKEIEDATKN